MAPSAGSAEDRVVAEVDGQVITSDEVDRALGRRPYRSDQERYQLQRQKLDDLIDEKLLQREAAHRRVSVERLREIEVKTRIRVTAQDVDAFYQERKDTVPAPEPAAKAAFRRYLEQQQELELTRQLLERLRSSASVHILLEAPSSNTPAYLVVPGAAFKGPRDAPITIVEFADFQCPFCARAQAVLRQVIETYPNDVRLVFRHFPVGKGEAKLAEAAECAAQQGRFWEYHDQIFADPSGLDAARLQSLGRAVGLDLETFSTCLESGESPARVAQDLADGRNAGVRGTPTFFVNGRMMEGVPPFITLKRLIDLQLALLGPRGAAQR